MYAYLYANRLAGSFKYTQKPLRLIISHDTRPSSPAIRDALVRGFLAAAEDAGVVVKIIDIGVATTPMAESAVRSFEDEYGKGADGGAIVTGSHNPLRDNGIKFMTSSERKEGEAGQGALVGVEDMQSIINDFQFVRRFESEFDRLRKRLMKIQDIPLSLIDESNFNTLREGYLNFIIGIYG